MRRHGNTLPRAFRHHVVLVLVLVLGAGIIPAPVAGQADDAEMVGDWRIGGSGDPFDDSVRQAYMYLATEQRRSIQAVAIACVAGADESRLELRVIHPYLIPDDDDENLVRLRFGEADSRIERGTAHTGNNRTDVRLQRADIEALRAVPNLAVRIIEGSSHSDDQYTESWSSLEGTAAAIDRTMAECGAEGSG